MSKLVVECQKTAPLNVLLAGTICSGVLTKKPIGRVEGEIEIQKITDEKLLCQFRGRCGYYLNN